MHDLLTLRVVELVRLATKIQNHLESAEDSIHSVNHTLAELAALRVRDLQIVGPLVYAQQPGATQDPDCPLILFQAIVLTHGGVGAAAWHASPSTEPSGPHPSEPTDLRPRFVPYADCLPLVRAMLVAHVGDMLDRLTTDPRLLG